MILRRTIGTGLLLCAALIPAFAASAGGISFGLPIYTIDVSETFAQVPVAAEAAFGEIDAALITHGLSLADRAEFRSGFEEGLDGVLEGLALAPTILPVPHLGATIEIGLPLVLLDGVRFSAGYLSDGILRWAADLAGFPVPSPIVDVAFDEGGLSGSVVGDLAFSSWMIRTELRKRLDVVIAALNLGAGVQLVGGAITPRIDIAAPADLEDGVSNALNALHLDGLTWSAFGLHALIGVELGPPFLRLSAEARFVLPISQSPGWWGIKLGRVGGSVGVVIRF